MRLFQLLFENSWVNTLLALLTGLIAGLSNAAILAVINTAIASMPNPPVMLLVSFIALAIVLLVTATAAEFFLAKHTQTVVYELVLSFSSSI